jgi:uncharacterized protein YbgA (DUF1722 family)/uncharacterized protein YbbK (DUF523 family)
VDDEIKPCVGIGSCLIGRPVRYNGESKRKNQYIEALKDCVVLQPFCPEMAIGMGVPRATVRLVGDIASPKLMDSATQTIDYTSPMRQYAADVLSSNPNIAGYVLVKGSPSCGFDRVKRYNDKGNVVLNDSMGVFSSALKEIDPLLPLEEDGRLHDHRLRENFTARVFAYDAWKNFCQEPVTPHRLTHFWSRYKYLIMSHHVPTYKQIGFVLAGARIEDIEDTSAQFIRMFMAGLEHLATRKTHSNVLQHIRGYLKRDLERNDKQEMDGLISQYRDGHVPLVVPMTLLRHHFAKHKNEYIDRQVYMLPYPERLSLRNHI